MLPSAEAPHHVRVAPPTLPENLDSLDHSLAALHVQLDTLEHRVRPVLRPEQDSEPQGPAIDATEDASEVSARLRTCRWQVERAIGRVDDVLGRLDFG